LVSWSHGTPVLRGISLDEAKETLDAWYRDRPEVKEWQDKTRKEAVKNLFVRTMMGRYRNLPEAASRGPGGSHSLRAAINTPIQVTHLSLPLSQLILASLSVCVS
jgi:DNA polymerase I